MPCRNAVLSVSLCAALLASGGWSTANAATQPAGVRAKAAPVSTDIGTVLAGMSAAGDLAVAAGHVFISPGRGGTDVAVRTATGTDAGQISGLRGASGMAVSRDGRQIFVALLEANAIAVIDAGTLSEVARIDTGPSSCPSDVAVVVRALYFIDACSSPGSASGMAVFGIDPALPMAVPVGIPGTWPATAIAASPNGDAIAVGVGTLTTYLVSGTTATLGAHGDASSPATCASANALAFSPDGATVYAACGSPNKTVRYDAATGGVLPGFATTAYPTTLAVAPDGTVASGTRSWDDPDVYLHTPTGQLLNTYEIGGTDGELVDGCLAWGSGGTLYAITKDAPSGVAPTLRLHVLRGASKQGTALTLTIPAGAHANAPFTVSGRLTVPNGSAAGRSVTVVRQAKGVTTRVGVATTGASGSWSITDVRTVAGTVRYTATFAGDAALASAVATLSSTIAARVPALTVRTSLTGVAAFGTRVTITAHLGPGPRDRTVEIFAQPAYKSRALLNRASVDAKGNLTATYVVTSNTQFVVFSQADRVYGARMVTTSVRSRAQLSTTWFGSYGRSGADHLYRRTVQPRVDVSVRPGATNDGSVVRGTLEVFSGGSWHLRNTAYATVGGGVANFSVVTVNGSPVNAPGRYRFRALYIAANQTNAATSTGWSYLRFV